MAQRNDPLGAEMQNGLGQLKVERVTSMSEATGIHVALQSALLNEAQRIEAKLGAEHVRSQLLRDRVASNAQVTQTLKVEGQLAQISLPQVEAEGALVYGRIIDEDDVGMDRLIVRLVDASGATIDVGTAASDDSGAFAIALDSQTVDRVIKSSPKGVLATVSTPKGRIVYTQSKPVTLAHGGRLLLEFRLSRIDLTPVPSPPGPDPFVVVPELIGKTEKDALALLKKMNLKHGGTESRTAPDQVGLVLEQRPAAGLSVPPESQVDLVVGGTETVTVPDLVGTTVRVARSRLKKAELTLGTIGGPSPTDASIIEKQSPAADAIVPKGASVDVTVRGAASPRSSR